MRKPQRIWRSFRWWLLPLAIALSLTARVGLAATLYERSVAKLAGRAEQVSPQEYSFVVMGDSKDSEEVFSKILALAASFKPLFILHVGDFSPEGSFPEVDHFVQILAQRVAEIPFFVVRGNHEQTQPFEERIGPRNFTLDNPRLALKVVAVDNSDYQLPASQLHYLQKQLATTRQSTFVAMHVPPTTARWSKHSFAEGAPELIDLMAARKITAAFYGHIHLYDRDELKGVPQFISGGAGARLSRFFYSGDPSYHILVVRVKEGVASYEMVKLGG